MGKTGDGRVGFFESAVFDIFRGAEGKAEASEDRAKRANRKAKEKRAAAKAVDLDIDDAELEAARITTPQGGASATIENPGQKRFLKKMTRKLKAVTEANEAQDEVISALMETQDQQRKILGKVVRTLIEERKRSRSMNRSITSLLIPAVESWIDIANVGDLPIVPSAKIAADSLQGLSDADTLPDDWETWVPLVALALKAYAYYDPDTGAGSVVQADTAPPVAPVAPVAPIAPEPVWPVEGGVDWAAVTAALTDSGYTAAATFIDSQYGGA